MSGPNAASSHADLSSKFGYLLKRGENNTELKKRFFQLRSKDLNYYKSHEDHIGDPQGTIDLRHAFSIAECDWDTTSSEDGDSAAASFGISIVCVVEDASRVWDLFAEDEHERSSWMAVLRPIVAENRIPQFGLRRSGWAVRQGGIFNGWSKRWLVLGHDSIALFRSQQRGTKYAALAPLEYRHTPKALLADASIGTMELFGCTVQKIGMYGGQQYTLLIEQSDGRRLFVAFENAQELQEWMVAITQASAIDL